MPAPFVGSCGFMGLILSSGAIAALAILSVWGIVVGAQAPPVTPDVCYANSTVPLNTWLIVSGSVFLGVLPIGTVAVCKLSSNSIAMVTTSIVYGLFNIIWSGIGWASLGSCAGSLLGNLSIATMVFQIYFYFPIYWLSLHLVQ